MDSISAMIVSRNDDVIYDVRLTCFYERNSIISQADIMCQVFSYTHYRTTYLITWNYGYFFFSKSIRRVLVLIFRSPWSRKNRASRSTHFFASYQELERYLRVLLEETDFRVSVRKVFLHYIICYFSVLMQVHFESSKTLTRWFFDLEFFNFLWWFTEFIKKVGPFQVSELHVDSK